MQELRSEYTGGEGESAGTTERTWDSQQRRASQTLRSAKEKAGVAYDRTADQAVRVYRSAREYAQANPGVAAAATFAAGLGVGMMMASHNGARAYRRGLVPVVAIARALAVLDVFDEAR
jgi:ElaB/YqjD/DUF883 family membrane-anchored ribosome-binding protein